jgi:hypothetical protein
MNGDAPLGRGLPRLRDWVARVHEPTREEQLKMRELSGEDGRRLRQPFDDQLPLPDGAAELLSANNPRLLALRRAYATLDLPSLQHSQWGPGNVDVFVDLRYFRGDTMITWHYRELPRATRLKLFIYLSYIQGRDDRGLLELLQEDGLFGCWTYEFPGRPVVSRDLLESVNELLFLQRRLSLLDRPGLRVLDIGAGYGRLAHRMTAAAELADYCCIDAIAEPTFLCEYYLTMRDCSPPARVLPLDQLDEIEPGKFDLAVNIHSFSECTEAAVRWWVEQLRRWEVPRLFVIPNEPDGMLSIEADGSRRDLMLVLAEAGYRLTVREPVIDDQAVREIVRLHDHFHLFELDG